MDSAKETLSSVQQKASETVGQVQETLTGSVSTPLLYIPHNAGALHAQYLASLLLPGSAAIWGCS